MRIAIRAETSHLQFHLNSGLERTHHLFDAKAIACLSHGAIVVNAARGGIVVDKGLKAAFCSVLAQISWGFGTEPLSSTPSAASSTPNLSRCADIRMPGMSGLELQAKLKAHRCRIPIIFITAHGDAKMRIQAMRDGAVEFLTKPFERSLNHVVAERKPVEFLDARALCTLRAKPLINIVQLEESWSSACHPRQEI